MVRAPTVQPERPDWMTSVVGAGCRFVSDEEGATAIEYGLLASMIAAFLVAALLALSSAESNMYAKWTDAANSAMGSSSP